MTEPLRILDLYAGAGGAGAGYEQAGCKIIASVDWKPQKRNPSTPTRRFYLENLAQMTPNELCVWTQELGVDAIHASPPCQWGTPLRHAPGNKPHTNLIPHTLKLVKATGLPYVIENPDSRAACFSLGAGTTMLCGSMFNLGAAGHQLQRHRLFKTNWPLEPPGPCVHTRPVIGMYGSHVRCRAAAAGGRGTRDFVGQDKPALAAEAMGIDWMTMSEMGQAVPPAYTRWIGNQLRKHLGR